MTREGTSVAFATILIWAEGACRFHCTLLAWVRRWCECSALAWWHRVLCNTGSEISPTGTALTAKTTHQQQGARLAAGKYYVHVMAAGSWTSQNALSEEDCVCESSSALQHSNSNTIMDTWSRMQQSIPPEELSLWFESICLTQSYGYHCVLKGDILALIIYKALACQYCGFTTGLCSIHAIPGCEIALKSCGERGAECILTLTRIQLTLKGGWMPSLWKDWKHNIPSIDMFLQYTKCSGMSPGSAASRYLYLPTWLIHVSWKLIATTLFWKECSVPLPQQLLLDLSLSHLLIHSLPRTAWWCNNEMCFEINMI